MKGKINEEEYSLANIYCPNSNPIKYAINIIKKFMDVKKGHTILGGDFNFSMSLGMDCPSSAQRTGYVLRKALKKTTTEPD